MPAKHVVVGLSGGVDSSVAAFKLLEQGYQVTGLFMKNWEEDDNEDYCSASIDLQDAQAVSDQLGIKLLSVNFSTEYWDNVFEYFLHEYRSGRTPNPDIMCNKEIKFKAFLNYALDLGADYIATGHYCQTDKVDQQARLLRGNDNNKDQSYFLYALEQRALQHTLFPIGHLEKPEVRKIAEQQGFTNARKKDSTGICFIGERKFKDFLQRFIPAQPGDIITEKGIVIGQHHGLMYYTLGQRQGLGIGGLANSQEGAWFVAKKQLENNQLIAVQGHNHPLLFEQCLEASQLTFLSTKKQPNTFYCTAKIRYRQADIQCHVSINNQVAQVVFDKKQRAITPGQSIVFYNKQECLGGGIIDRAYS